MTKHPWTNFKTLVYNQDLFIRMDERDACYYLTALDGPITHRCDIVKTDPASADQLDFETNYKASVNKKFTQADTDGAEIVRIKAAKKGWSFWAVPIEFTTCLLSNNLHCKDVNGNDIAGISYRIYDSNDVQITVPGLANINLSTCTKTVIDFEPPFDYEIIGGSVRTNGNIGSDVRLWIVGAPDIPANLGGSKEFASGINLKFLAPDSSFEVDGRVTKFMKYNATYHSGKIRLVLKHPAGAQINIQLVIQVYRE